MSYEVDLVFMRADNPSKKVTLKAHPDDDIVDYVLLAAKKLGFNPDDPVGIATTDGRPVKIVGRPVRDVVMQRGNVFILGSEDILGW